MWIVIIGFCIAELSRCAVGRTCLRGGPLEELSGRGLHHDAVNVVGWMVALVVVMVMHLLALNLTCSAIMTHYHLMCRSVSRGWLASR